MTERLNPQDLLEHVHQLIQRNAQAGELETLVRQVIEQEQHARLTAETLLQASGALNSTLELKQVLDIILEQIQRVVNFDSASVMLLEGNQLRVLAVRGHPFPDAALKVTFPLHENDLAWHLIQVNQAMIIADAQQDPRFQRLGNTSYVHGWMGVPMIERGQVIGLLTLDSRQTDAYATEDARGSPRLCQPGSIGCYERPPF